MSVTLNQLWQIAGSGIHARQRQLDILSHNVANLNTVGYKASQPGFQALIRERRLSEEEAMIFAVANPGDLIQEGMGTVLTHETKLFSQGSLMQTNDPYHLAIIGDGFFQVAAPNGELLYTRGGDFVRNVDGRLVTNNGYVLQPLIDLPEEVTEVYIDGEGVLFGRTVDNPEPAIFGQVQLARFPNVDGLESAGDSMFRPTDASGVAEIGDPNQDGLGGLLSGYLEGSNVDMGREMTKLLQSQRAYTLSLRSLRVADEIFQMANQLSRQ